MHAPLYFIFRVTGASRLVCLRQMWIFGSQVEDYSPNKNKKRPAPHVEVTEQNKSVSRSFQKLLNVKSFHAYCNGYS